METITYPYEIKAVKEHTCNFCGFTINKQETYIKSTHKADGGIYTWKTHKYCEQLAKRLKMYDNADEGVSMDDFIETIHCSHDDILTNELLLGIDSKQKYNNIIQQLRKVPFKDKLWFLVRYYKLFV